MEEVVRAIMGNSCVLFAGAGVSCDAGLPDWLGLGTQLYDRLNSKNLLPEDSKRLVSSQLTKESIQRAIDLLLTLVNRSYVATELRDILSPKKESVVYKILRKCGFRGFVTTNYDRLLDAILKPNAWRLSNSVADLKTLESAAGFNQAQFLLKLHGDLDHLLPPDDLEVIKGGHFMILTSGDFQVFLAQRLENIRLALHTVLSHYSVLFLGYGFADPGISHILAFLAQHCKFPRASWFIGTKQERLPVLPDNITGIQPIDNWLQLPAWLNEVYRAVSKTPPVALTKEPPVAKVPEEVRHAFQALAEYLQGLQSDNLCTKAIVCIFVPQLLDKDTLGLDEFIQFAGKVLDVGPKWAEAFAKAAITEMVDLKMIRECEEDAQKFTIVKHRIKQLDYRASIEWLDDKNQFFKSVETRLSKSGVPLSETFGEMLDAVLQHLCMRFGGTMAEWVHKGIGREPGISHIRELVSVYFTDPEEKRVATELLTLILESPADAEIAYLYRLLSSAFLLSSVRLEPTAAKLLKEAISRYELYLDSNIILRLVIKEHKNHSWIKSIIDSSRQAGVTLVTLEDILKEVLAHKKIAHEISREYGGDIEKLTSYVEGIGERANCFAHGYVNFVKVKHLPMRDYLLGYTDQRIQEMLDKFGINVVPAHLSPALRKFYPSVLSAISEEWEKKQHPVGHVPQLRISRAEVLNETEATQFLHIYSKRRQRVERGNTDDVWFLSFETVFERVYLREPQSWGKPPTFPFSAWASFLDSQLISEHKNRKHILNAITKGYSTGYDLPDPVSFIQRKLFGSRPLSKSEFDALQTALSDGRVFDQFEKARQALIKRGRKEEAVVKEFTDVRDSLVDQVVAEIMDKVRTLEHRLSESLKASGEEKMKLRQQIEELKATAKGRRRHKRR